MINKVVSIEYTLKDANTNEQLDTNVGGAPLEYISGMQQIIPGLEKELENLSKGDKVDVLVKSEDAYGEYSDEAVQSVPKEQFAGIELETGMTLYGTGENGDTVQVVVKELKDDNVVVDYNHPMAGKSLMFNVTILDLRDATDEEIQVGVVGGMAATGGCGCGDEDCDTTDQINQNDSCCSGGHCS